MHVRTWSFYAFILVFQLSGGIYLSALPDMEGETVALKIPAGTDVGTVLRIPGKGLPRMNSSSRGDLLVRVAVDIPKRVTAEQRELLTKLDSTAGSKARKGKSKLRDKIQDTIEDLTN